MLEDLKKAQKKYLQEIRKTDSEQKLEELRIKILGRNGLLNRFFSQIGEKSVEEKRQWGQDLNQIKNSLKSGIIRQQKRIKKKEKERVLTEPKYTLKKNGHLHPITTTTREINALFAKIGFSVYDGPELETDEYCFRRLNVPKDHPARDLQDTIYIQEPEILLRTQTSSAEARLLEKEKPPFRAVIPGRVYRFEKVTKSNHFVFHHYQGVAVDKKLNLKDLIGIFQLLFEYIYGKRAVVRYRCKYYPEVEPGLGLDLQCFSCQGKGCSLCKGAGWIEMGGAGLIHPLVMKFSGLNPQKWQGFAFGLGLDRWAMAKYKIKDIRTLTGGNLAFLGY